MTETRRSRVHRARSAVAGWPGPAAGRAFFTKMLDALGVRSDSPFLALDESFRHPLTVGRPVDVREPVMMPDPEPPAAQA